MNFLSGQFGYLISKQTIAGQFVFKRDNDYEKFLNRLKLYKGKHQIKIFGFCLLPNALYLILNARKSEEIRIFLEEICHTQSKFYQRCWPKHPSCLRISNDQDLFEAIKYVEFIPARLGLVDSPLHYPWSSCSYRVVGNSAGFLDTSALVIPE